MRASPALHIAPSSGGLLSVNFARELLAMTAEVVQWERLRMAVPYVAMEIQAQRDKYRALREHALALVSSGATGGPVGPRILTVELGTEAEGLFYAELSGQVIHFHHFW